MNNVSLTIGGRDLLVGCARGEEDRLRALGRKIEEKVDAANARGLSETRMLLFAALLLADENEELRRKASAPPPVSQAAQAPQDEERLVRIAETMEKLASLLESGANDL